MKLPLLGLENRLAAIGAIDVNPFDLDRATLGIGRHAAHGKPRPVPVGGQTGRLLENREGDRPGHVADQPGRMIDLGSEGDGFGLEGIGRLAVLDLGGRIVAVRLNGERKAADRLRAAGIDAAGGGLALHPAG